jgi:hypothetical protein
VPELNGEPFSMVRSGSACSVPRTDSTCAESALCNWSNWCITPHMHVLEAVTACIWKHVITSTLVQHMKREPSEPDLSLSYTLLISHINVYDLI